MKIHKMCLSLAMALLFSILNTVNIFAQQSEDLALNCKSAVLMDYETGQILYEKNMSEKAFPASTTKIMTAILAIENSFPEELMTVSKEAIDIAEPLSTNISLKEGEQLTVNDGLFALMLHSANDVANVLAEHVAGSQEEFASRMTAKAKAIGAKDTHFNNAHGLSDDNHYTTAYDLAVITRYAMGDKRFMQYFGAEYYTMAKTNIKETQRSFSNFQYMVLQKSKYYYPGILGGKIGYTDEAQHTMSTVAEQNGQKLICIVMGEPGDEAKYSDTKKLLDYGFSQFELVTVGSEEFERFQVPVVPTGTQQSKIMFDSMPEVKIYLHKNYIDEELKLSYIYPDNFNYEDYYTAQVSIYADKTPPGMPNLLNTVKISGVYSQAQPIPSAEVEIRESRQSVVKEKTLYRISGQKLSLILISMVLAILLICLLNNYANRRKQIERLNRIRRTIRS